MSQKWFTSPLNLPPDETLCLVRLNYWFGPPFLATYSNAAQEWTSQTNSVVYPVWSVSRWRYSF